MLRIASFDSLVALSLLLAAPTFAGDGKVDVTGEIKTLAPRADPKALPPIFGARMPLTLDVKPVAGAPSAPEGAVDVLNGSIAIAGKNLALVVARSSDVAECHDLIAIDLDADGAFAEAERRVVKPQKQNAGTSSVWTSEVTDLEVQGAGMDLPFSLAYMKFGDEPATVTVVMRWYLDARVKLGDAEIAIVAQDGDGDVRFDGAKDRWGVLAADRVGKDRLRPSALSPLEESRFLPADVHLTPRGFTNLLGRQLRITARGPTAFTLTWNDAEGPDPADMEHARERVEKEWAEWFDKEREQFVKDHGIDTSRPLAKEPVKWRYVTIDAAKKMASVEKKPLFVDVMAFWCVWCYRMDYYTYPDAEVASLLNERFVAVKLIEEQDLAGEYAAVKSELEAKGIPAMGIWSPSGELLRKIDGWKAPKDFVVDLTAALEGDAKSDGSH